MKKRRYIRIYDLHSWTGIALGLFVYVVSFTGCLALFDHELQTWEDPAKRLVIAENIVPIMPKFEDWLNRNSRDKTIRSISFLYPQLHAPYFEAFLSTQDKDGERANHVTRWETEQGVELKVKQGALTEWILDFHRDLMWPTQLGGRTVGRAIVGAAGVILLLSIITGFITHKKIIREFFTLRVKRSVHLKWQDLHKILGLWALPFYTMIAFTGAFLGIIVILAPIAAALAFKGDTEALIAAVNGTELEPSGVQAKMLSLDEIKKLRHPVSNLYPDQVSVTNWGDETATYSVRYPAINKLNRFDRLSLNAVTGEINESNVSTSKHIADRVQATITPLHYATYGGIWLKALYVILGIFLCVVTATGLMVWIERRLKSNKGQRKPEFYLGLGRFANGIILGFPLASVAIFYLDKLYIGAQSSQLFYTGLCYFATVLLTIMFAMFRKKDYQTTKTLFIITSLGLIGLPLVNAAVTKSFFWQSLTTKQTWVWADVTFLVVGILLLLISKYLPTQRAEEPRNKKRRI